MAPTMRADAVRNRGLVLDAARAVFAERGFEAGVPEVAERAGVGKATVYRSFPTKEHLIAAVAIAKLEDFRARAVARLEEPDAYAALAALLDESAARQCADRAITATMASVVQLPDLAAARRAVWEPVEALMERAKAQGTLRADARPEDLRVQWVGAARLLAAEGVEDPATWQRHAGLALRALAAER
jgi:AcrR family transcriptional regulator